MLFVWKTKVKLLFKIHLICGARPNFMKIAPLYHILKKEQWCQVFIIHTGQHYDLMMSDVFLSNLGLPKPDFHFLKCNKSHAEQTGNIMIAYEKLCLKDRPDLVVVVGDVNSTIACSIAAKKLQLKVAHLEAGLRSYDRSMPEEINRVITDVIADILWTPSEDADQNLIKEGIAIEKIQRVGNIMIDTYCMLESKINIIDTWKKFNLVKGQYIVCTFHRPVNVDFRNRLHKIITVLNNIGLPCVFPMHPRTYKNFIKLTNCKNDNIIVTKPLSYIEFMNLLKNCKFIITDSGGIQEESTYLKIPCYTLRTSTERPITINIGSNTLVTMENLEEKITYFKKSEIPKLWDGKTAVRITKLLKDKFS